MAMLVYRRVLPSRCHCSFKPALCPQERFESIAGLLQHAHWTEGAGKLRIQEETWRIIPVSKWLVTFIYEPFSPFGRGITLLRGLTITMVISHLLTGLILQEASSGKDCSGWVGWKPVLDEVPKDFPEWQWSVMMFFHKWVSTQK